MTQQEPLAKPSGISYRDHRQHVMDEAGRVLEAWPFLAGKYARRTGHDLNFLLKRAAFWHDAGKCDSVWQDACRADYERYRAWREQKGLDPEGTDPQEFEEYKRADKQQGSHLREAGFRHEFASLRIAEEKLAKKNQELTFAERAAIAAHHGKFGHRYAYRWEKDGKKDKDDPDEEGPFRRFWESFKEEDKDLRMSGAEWAEFVRKRYEQAALRALLQLADTRASRAEGGGELPKLERFAYDFKHPGKRAVQRKAEEMAEANVSPGILRAPTGSGKTDACLLWAKKHVEAGRADRLVIAMPTRFTSNALALSVEESVSETGLYHSSAWHNRYGGLSDRQAKSNAKEQHLLAQHLATPVTVCTVDHLLMCLTGVKEAHYSTFFFLANSAVVFDEADFYDPFLQANLTVLMETLRLLDVPVLIMSATVPDSSRKLYEVAEPIAEADDKDEGRAPSRRSLAWGGAAETPEDAADTLDEMIEARKGIVYANTVKSALRYYDYLKREAGGSLPVVLYHSRFTEPGKKDVESRLLEQLGKKQWQDGTAEGIAVLTQIGEMSVNISAPLMLSEACPWDRLAQRAGRLNRFGECEEGRLVVIEPTKDGEAYPAPYGSFNRGQGWQPAEAFSETLADMKKRLPEDGAPVPFTPEDFVEAVNALYPKPPEFSSHAETNRADLRKLVKENWLIRQDAACDEDDATIYGKWKSRDIDAQATVLTEPLPEEFRNYDEYRAFELKCGVACPQGLIDKELRKKEGGKIEKVSVRIGMGEKMEDRDPETVYFTNAYDEAKGMAFLYEEVSVADPKNRMQ